MVPRQRWHHPCVNNAAIDCWRSTANKGTTHRKGWNVDRMIAEFPASEWKGRTSAVKKSMTLITWNKSWSAAGTELASKQLINAVIDQRLKRLLLVIRSQGGHIEHRLRWFRRSMNVLTHSLMISTDNVVGSEAILSHQLRKPLFKFDFILLRVLLCFLVAK